jgi:hypothetical protein
LAMVGAIVWLNFDGDGEVASSSRVYVLGVQVVMLTFCEVVPLWDFLWCLEPAIVKIASIVIQSKVEDRGGVCVWTWSLVQQNLATIVTGHVKTISCGSRWHKPSFVEIADFGALVDFCFKLSS